MIAVVQNGRFGVRSERSISLAEHGLAKRGLTLAV